MTSQTEGKVTAKMRYDAKMPTVSFRVSREEYERLDALRKSDDRSFREMVLTGAGMIEKDKAAERKRCADEEKKLEEAVKRAKYEALKNVQIGVCRRCANPLYWDLTKIEQLRKFADYLWEIDYPHPQCKNRHRVLTKKMMSPEQLNDR